MKRSVRVKAFLFVFFIAISACNKNDETPRGEFATGVIVVNEGNFGDADGSVGFYDPAKETAVQDIYEKANGESLSGTIQSVYFYEDNAYIIDQSGNKIEVVEAETFKHVATINQGLDVPRYMTVVNGKGYVSNWGPYDQNYDLPDSYIAVIDLKNFNVIKTLNTQNGVEGMITIDDKVYAAASASNVVHTIDSELDEIVGGFTTPSGPRVFALDGHGKLWVLCNDYVSSAIARLDVSSELVDKSFSVAGGAKSIAVDNSGNNIYYLSTPYGASAGVFEIDYTATFAPLEPIISGDGFYGLGVDTSDGTIYVGKSNGADNGTVILYDSEGNELSNFSSGRFPNGFVFRE